MNLIPDAIKRLLPAYSQTETLGQLQPAGKEPKSNDYECDIMIMNVGVSLEVSIVSVFVVIRCVYHCLYMYGSCRVPYVYKQFVYISLPHRMNH